MKTLRSAAAAWLGRFGVPGILSLLIHTVVVVQRLPQEVPEPVEEIPLTVDLRRAPPAHLPPVARPRSEIPRPPESPERPPPRRLPGRPRAQRSAPADPAPLPQPESSAVPELPPEREIGAILRGAAVATAPRGEHRKPQAAPRSEVEAPPTEPDAVPLHLPESSTAGGPPGSGGAGFSFDFWSPPDFRKEMARANREIGAREREHQRTIATDHGHGVICNTDGAWFLCSHDDIERCNSEHDGMCRYAKPKERWFLTEEVILFQ